MAHSHADSHGEPESTYFLDQLCTIAVAGLLGFTAIGLYYKGWLTTKFNLINQFHIPVLVGGILLIVMVVLRAIALWRQAGRANLATHDAEDEHGEHSGHDRAHTENCGHDHGHSHSHSEAHSHSESHSHSHAHSHASTSAPAHAHEEEHDHGWAPWQYAILIVPAVLFFLELPLDGYNKTRLNQDLEEVELESGKAAQRQALANLTGSMILPLFKKNNKPDHLQFSELNVRRGREKDREYFDGRTVVLVGQLRKTPGKDNEFQLYRVMVNCCGTDALTFKSRMIAPEPLQGLRDDDWVSVTGELTFQKMAGKEDDWMPVLIIPSMDKIQKIKAPADANSGV